MVSRRSVIRGILAGISIPMVSPKISLAATQKNRCLILVELSGANDGLNTVVPINDHRYYDLRPTIALQKKDTFSISSDFAFHASLTPLDDALQSGELAVVQGLGYPGQNRSHFKSIELWETGGDGSGAKTTGWLTKDIEALSKQGDFDADGMSLDGDMGLFLSTSGNWISATSINQLQREPIHAFTSSDTYGSENPALNALLQQHVRLQKTIQNINSKLSKYKTFRHENFGAGDFGLQAAMAAHLIQSGVSVPVLKISLGGFDTHEFQYWRHRQLLLELSTGLAGLRAALKQSGHWEHTLVMSYSEFGRRAAENNSEGTDHGAAAPHFMLSGALNGGLWGRHPDLSNLSDGDLRYTMDYRCVYHTVLSQWFGIHKNKFAQFDNPHLRNLIRT